MTFVAGFIGGVAGSLAISMSAILAGAGVLLAFSAMIRGGGAPLYELADGSGELPQLPAASVQSDDR